MESIDTVVFSGNRNEAKKSLNNWYNTERNNVSIINIETINEFSGGNMRDVESKFKELRVWFFKK